MLELHHNADVATQRRGRKFSKQCNDILPIFSSGLFCDEWNLEWKRLCFSCLSPSGGAECLLLVGQTDWEGTGLADIPPQLFEDISRSLL